MKGINNKGFTLVELLAVLVILAAIMGIALPSITSSMERTKEKQNEQKIKMLESFAEVYVADHKNAIYSKMGSNTKCYIEINTLKSGGYLSDDADIDVDGNPLSGYVTFERTTNSYEYVTSVTGIVSCS